MRACQPKPHGKLVSFRNIVDIWFIHLGRKSHILLVAETNLYLFILGKSKKRNKTMIERELEVIYVTKQHISIISIL